MIERLQRHSNTIVIAVTFYVSGFFSVANMLTLSNREIVLGLAAGAIGGLCAFVSVLTHEQRAERSVPT